MKFIAKIVFLHLLITYSWTYDAAMKTFLQKCTSKCNKKYCNITSPCRPVNRTSKLLSLDIYFHPGVKLNAPLNIEVNAYRKFTTVYRPFMIKIKVEICAQLLQKSHILIKILEKFGDIDGNLTDPCPISGHRYLNPRFSSDDSFLLPLIPIGEWIFEIALKKDIEELIFSWSLFYEIKPSGAEQF